MLIRSLQLIVVSVISLWVPVCPIFLVTREKKKKEGKRRALPQQPPHATFPRPRIRTRFFFFRNGPYKLLYLRASREKRVVRTSGSALVAACASCGVAAKKKNHAVHHINSCDSHQIKGTTRGAWNKIDMFIKFAAA